ncbi:MAG TPA: O-antigen ligase family protein [Acidiferrobacteraceae bacterium]|nr:O-antigen ligase family protein [Acidiferrobacteraceae bacterium]
MRPSLKNYLVGAALMLYPVLLLTRQGAMNGCFLLLEVVALAWLVSPAAREQRGPWDAATWAYTLAMVALIPAILMSEVVNHQLQPQPYDGAARFLAAVPVYLLLRRTPARILRITQYSFPAGAVASALMAWAHPTYFGLRVGSSFLDPIRLGDLSLALGFMSLLSLNGYATDRPALRILKWLGVACALYVSAVSGSRGGWLAIPPVLLIWVLHARRSGSRRYLLPGLLAAAAVAVGSYWVVPEIHHRINDISRNFAALKAGNPNTSVGERLMLWKVAWQLFWSHPVFGVGPDGFQQAMMPLYHAGVLTRTVAWTGTTEVHSDIIARVVRYGIFGLAAILAVYLVPLALFVRQARHGATRFMRAAAVMGLGFVVAYLVFGLTIELFDLTMNAAFYSLTVAVFLAMATHLEPGPDDAHTALPLAPTLADDLDRGRVRPTYLRW